MVARAAKVQAQASFWLLPIWWENWGGCFSYQLTFSKEGLAETTFLKPGLDSVLQCHDKGPEQ